MRAFNILILFLWGTNSFLHPVGYADFLINQQKSLVEQTNRRCISKGVFYIHSIPYPIGQSLTSVELSKDSLSSKKPKRRQEIFWIPIFLFGGATLYTGLGSEVFYLRYKDEKSPTECLRLKEKSNRWALYRNIFAGLTCLSLGCYIFLKW